MSFSCPDVTLPIRLPSSLLAESNLLEAHSIFAQTRGESHANTLACVQNLAALYDLWHTAEPGEGYDAKAADWRAKLEELQASTRPATQPATSRTAPESHAQVKSISTQLSRSTLLASVTRSRVASLSPSWL